MASILCAYDKANGRFPKNAIGSFEASYFDQWESLTVVTIRGRLPSGPLHKNYKVAENGGVYRLEKLTVPERWSLEIVGSDTITVQGTETYTVKKIGADGSDILSGSEEVTLMVERGLLSTQTVSLTDGQGAFDLTAANETVASRIKACFEDRDCPLKRIDFVL
jgi:hypothetical protein